MQSQKAESLVFICGNK